MTLDTTGRIIIALMLALCGLMLCSLATTWVQIVVSVCVG